MDIDIIRKEAYKKVLDIMSIINNENVDNFHDLDSIQYRIKTKDGILKKMNKVGNNVYDVYDLIGIRYVFHNLNIADKFLKNIISIKEFEVIEIRDYLDKGHPEDPNYKALHIRLKYNGFPCEVEILDSKMNEHVILTHDDYKNGLLK